MRLAGKVVVVTGAGSALGAAVARRFAREGARVVAGDADVERLDAVVVEVRGRGGAIIGITGDPASSVDVEALLRGAMDVFDGIDVLVNYPGVTDAREGVAEVGDEAWRRVLAVGLTGPMIATRLAVRYMRAHQGGTILNVTSGAGLVGGEGGAACTSAQHGLIGLTRNTAVAYGRLGVRCNALIAGAGPFVPEAVATLAVYLASDAAVRLNGGVIPAAPGTGRLEA